MNYVPKSNCCNALVKIVGGDEGTNHYECTKCGKACDLEAGSWQKAASKQPKPKQGEEWGEK